MDVRASDSSDVDGPSPESPNWQIETRQEGGGLTKWKAVETRTETEASGPAAALAVLILVIILVLASPGNDDDDDPIEVYRSESAWVARHTELGVASQGQTREEALGNLDDAVKLHTGEKGRPVTDEDLEELGIDPDDIPDEPQKPDAPWLSED